MRWKRRVIWSVEDSGMEGWDWFWGGVVYPGRRVVRVRTWTGESEKVRGKSAVGGRVRRYLIRDRKLATSPEDLWKKSSDRKEGDLESGTTRGQVTAGRCISLVEKVGPDKPHH